MEARWGGRSNPTGVLPISGPLARTAGQKFGDTAAPILDTGADDWMMAFR